jgi:hypothetical protein
MGMGSGGTQSGFEKALGAFGRTCNETTGRETIESRQFAPCVAPRPDATDREQPTLMSADAMTCRELVQRVTDYLEDVLPVADRVRFDTHLQGCRSCLAHLAQVHRTLEALGQLREEDVSVEEQAALLGAFRRWKLA